MLLHLAQLLLRHAAAELVNLDDALTSAALLTVACLHVREQGQHAALFLTPRPRLGGRSCSQSQ
jgi:hypothetical protein